MDTSTDDPREIMRLVADNFRGIRPDETPRQYAVAFGLKLLDELDAEAEERRARQDQQPEPSSQLREERMAMFKAATKGISAYDVALALNSLHRGVDYRNCTKAYLTKCFADGDLGRSLLDVTEDDLRAAIKERLAAKEKRAAEISESVRRGREAAHAFLVDRRPKVTFLKEHPENDL